MPNHSGFVLAKFTIPASSSNPTTKIKGVSFTKAKKVFAIPGITNFKDRVNLDLENSLSNGAWIDVKNILIELSRGYFPELERKVINRIDKALGTMSVSTEKDTILGLATCYIMQPESLDLRKKLIRSNRIPVKAFLKDPKCFRHARDSFEKSLSKWSPSNLYFYQDNNDISFIQFIDSVLSTAHVRGFNTKYSWKIFIEGGSKMPFAQGNVMMKEGGNGSIQLNLMKSADKKFKFPEGQILRLELVAKRTHPRNFKSLESERTGIRFIVQPWFDYIGPNPPKIRVILH